MLDVISRGSKRPYIATVHWYAPTTNEDIAVGIDNSDFQQPENDAESPRYQIDIRGLASYRNLNESTRTVIRTMIDRAKNRVFYNTPGNMG
jgi:hypothetical protein